MSKRIESISVIGLISILLSLHVSSLNAQDWRQAGSQRRAVEGTPSNNTYNGSNLWNTPRKSHLSRAEQEHQQQLTEAQNSNRYGVELSNKGDWSNALTYFKEAVNKDPDNEVMRENLAQAEARVAAEKGLTCYQKGDFINAVAFCQEAVNKNPYENNQTVYKDNLALAKIALDAQLTTNQNQLRDKAAAANMQQAINNYAQSLNVAPAASGGLDFDGRNFVNPPTGNGSGLDFISTSPAQGRSKPVGSLEFGDPAIVDARNVPSGLTKSMDYAIAQVYNTVPGLSDRVRKGFQAVETKDWKVAKAWFQDALKLDPENKGLQNFIALCDYTPGIRPDKNATAQKIPVPAIAASTYVPTSDEIEAFLENHRALEKGDFFIPNDASSFSYKFHDYILSLNAEEFNKFLSIQLPIKEDMELMFDIIIPSAPLTKPKGNVPEGNKN